MDSITHLLLGGALAAAMAPAKHRRVALLAGAAINTLPDLDVIPLFLLSDDPVIHMTWHRAATHSLLVLPLVAWALWAWLKRCWTPVRQAPRRWFWLILVNLLAHPLIDACTIYGTQLLWPLPVPPVMWSSLFIIDPLFTLPLLLACLGVAWLGQRDAARRVAAIGIALASAYVLWSALAKWQVERVAELSLALAGLNEAPHFSVPMPFNTLLWRVVAVTPQGFVEGEYSLVADSGPIRFRHYPSDAAALQLVADYPAVRELLWFNHHFMKAEVVDGQLVLTDLRMGAEPDYSFRFAVARHDGQRWREIPPQQQRWPWYARKRLPAMWRRIWHAEAGPAGESP